MILDSISHPDLIKAMDTNTEELLALWGRALGATFYQEPEVSWFVSGVPFIRLNMVVRANLTPETPEEKIHEVLTKIESANTAISWVAGPSLQHPKIAHLVQAHGWSTVSVAGMAADLKQMDEHIHLPAGATLERVETTESLQQMVSTIAGGMPWPDVGRDYILNFVQKHGFVAHPAVRYYLARLNGEPVATALLFLGGGVAGLYCVATLPHARQQGIGRAISQLPLLDARAMGYHVAVLQAINAGAKVYRSLGFEQQCRIDFWIH